MLTQKEAEELIKVLKHFQNKVHSIKMPSPTEDLQLNLESIESKHDKFIIDVNRKGQYNLKNVLFRHVIKNPYNCLDLISKDLHI